MSHTVCKLPKAGLGNQLFPLMKAQVFAHLNNLPIIIVGYHQLKIGPYLRKEKTKRKYKGFFVFEKNILLTFFDRIKLFKYILENIIKEPPIETNDKNRNNQHLMFLFSKMPHWENYFLGLNEHRDLVKKLLWNLINPVLQKKINDLPPPYIGVHIRMGDFRKLKKDQNFAELGAIRTPELFFIEIIREIRKLNGSDLPVSIFSDGFKDELKEILSLKNIQLIEGNSDLVDMMLLSKSKIIITSAGSTFSYWASFLSDAAVIMHPDHITKIRQFENINVPYEGMFKPENLLFNNYIKNIKVS